MVSDTELEVWQDGEALYIQSHYGNDPMFTIDQEKALHEIAKSFLMVNRQTARRKRYAEKKKARASDDKTRIYLHPMWQDIPKPHAKRMAVQEADTQSHALVLLVFLQEPV